VPKRNKDHQKLSWLSGQGEGGGKKGGWEKKQPSFKVALFPSQPVKAELLIELAAQSINCDTLLCLSCDEIIEGIIARS
jgi:hypothetical protein